MSRVIVLTEFLGRYPNRHDEAETFAVFGGEELKNSGKSGNKVLVDNQGLRVAFSQIVLNGKNVVAAHRTQGGRTLPGAEVKTTFMLDPELLQMFT